MTRRRTVLCVGLTTLDVVHHVAEQPRWGHKQRSVGGELVAGGPAANAAVAAARLLGGARLVTAIGAGPAAGPVFVDLDAHGVELTDLAPVGWSLPVASALVDVRTGDRTVVSPGALGPGGVRPPSGGLHVLLDDVGAVLLDGHHPLVAARVATLATQARVPVLLDAGSWKDDIEAVLPRVGVAACSADFEPPSGPRAGDDPLGVATALHRYGVPTVLVTDGPRPVVWSTMDGDRGVVEVPRIQPVDTLGAGDAFHGALAAAIAVGTRSVPAAVGFAVEVAGVRCGMLGSRRWLTDPALEAAARGLRGLPRGAPAR
jgi:sugar/nucleoside kinase (ribokinase family)